MQSGSWIQTTGPNNGHQLGDYSKSSNRSESPDLLRNFNKVICFLQASAMQFCTQNYKKISENVSISFTFLLKSHKI